jgi:hypothetical protein
MVNSHHVLLETSRSTPSAAQEGGGIKPVTMAAKIMTSRLFSVAAAGRVVLGPPLPKAADPLSRFAALIAKRRTRLAAAERMGSTALCTNNFRSN